MGQYVVVIDNQESNKNADVISMTGRVNKTPVAAKVRISAMAKLTEVEQKRAKYKALINAYESAIQDIPVAAGEVVIM